MRVMVEAEGFVTIDDLAEAHDVSAMTVHRDLEKLQQEGWLRKVRGGATALPSIHHHGDVFHRSMAMRPQKEAIAEQARQLIQPGMSVILDDSTTALALAQHLSAIDSLTVITNFLATANALASSPDVVLILLGGQYYPAYDAFLGMRTIEACQSLRADIIFMSTTAITGDHCYHQSSETVAVKRELLASADQKVLLADNSKFEKTGLHRFVSLTEFDRVIVDHDSPQDAIATFDNLGVGYTIANT